jgi:hypothetical protein
VDAPALASLAGLEGVVTIEYDLLLRNNAVATLAPLSSLTNVGRVTLANMPSLTNIDALGGVASTTFGAGLELEDLPLLSSLPAFTALPSLRSLVVRRTGLTTMSSLASLQSVTFDFIVEENASLVTLGLGALTNVAGAVTIRDNPELPDCEATALASGITTFGEVTISGNNASCP